MCLLYSDDSQGHQGETDVDKDVVKNDSQHKKSVAKDKKSAMIDEEDPANVDIYSCTRALVRAIPPQIDLHPPP